MNNATRALLRYYYSQLLTRIHLDELAIEQLRTAVSADRNCARAWRSLGFMLANGDRTDEAISSLLRALEIEGDDAVTRFNLGFIYHTQKRIPEAISQFEQATALSAGLITAMVQLQSASIGIQSGLLFLSLFTGILGMLFTLPLLLMLS